MKSTKICFLVFGFIFIAFVVSAADKLHSEISAATAEWVKAYNAGNIAAVVELYADDAKVMPPNSDFVTGRQGITAVFQGMLDSGAKSVTLTPVEVMGSGNTALEVGTYEVMDKDGKSLEKGKYMVHWKKVGSAWKLHRDIWNSSMPATPAQ